MRRSLLAGAVVIAALPACSSSAAKSPAAAASKGPVAAAATGTALPIPAGSGTSLLALAGTGRATTKTFTVSRAWSVSWNYDCTGVSSLTNFQIYPTSSNPSVIVIHQRPEHARARPDVVRPDRALLPACQHRVRVEPAGAAVTLRFTRAAAPPSERPGCRRCSPGPRVMSPASIRMVRLPLSTRNSSSVSGWLCGLNSPRVFSTRTS
jgi:hypothetical protein